MGKKESCMSAEHFSSNEIVVQLAKWYALKGEPCFREAAGEIKRLRGELEACEQHVKILQEARAAHEPFHSLASEPSAANSGQCESRKTAQSGTGAGLSLPPEVGPMCIICGESFSRHSIKYELVNMFAPNAVKFACPAVTKSESL
jgi:hypothetical protein